MNSGWLNVDKPSGMTSFQVVARLRKFIGRCRIGHAGTLDPLATGVLPIAVGAATRTIEFHHRHPKTYLADILFGVTTDTYDTEGQVVSRSDASGLTDDEILAALERFRGDIEQVPPLYSALKQQGKPLYRIAREGGTAIPASRRVRVFRLEALEATPPAARLEIECSGGTYIRSLAHDLGQALGVGAHLTALRRTAYGPFGIDTAAQPDAISTREDIFRRFLPVDYGLEILPRLDIGENSAEKIVHGVITDDLREELALGNTWRLYDPEGKLVAIVDTAEEKPRLKVFAEPPAADEDRE